jgi:hypothetical protein
MSDAGQSNLKSDNFPGAKQQRSSSIQLAHLGLGKHFK